MARTTPTRTGFEQAPYFASLNQSRIHGGVRQEGNLFVPAYSVQRTSFDTVQICLRGCIRSSIGSKTVIEDLVSLTDVRTIEDFHQATPSDERLLNFTFDVPATSRVQNGKDLGHELSLPPSLSLTGSSYITNSTALSDRRLLSGACDVSYWLEANFLQGEELTQRVQHPIKLAFSATGVHLGSPSNALDVAKVVARPSLLQRCWSKDSPPGLVFSVFKPHAESIVQAPNGRVESIAFPVSISLPHSSHATAAACLLQQQSLRCSIEARWEMGTRFTGPRQNGAHQTITRIWTSSAAQCKLDLPPLCKLDAGVYAATSELVLSIPELIQGTSISTDLLSRAYLVDLTLKLEADRLPKYQAKIRIPVSVVQCIKRKSSNHNDTDLDTFDVHACLEAPPPYVP